MDANVADPITVQLNGQAHRLAKNTTVGGLLAQLALNPSMVVVELDGDILERDQYPRTGLRDGVQVEIVHFVGGGRA
ncbi:MAG: sulfur carrier protein ThiS [Lentisphaeria bacterium]|jgi:thiamine biosynthesis protein ThiS|nr:sulfur carrier protein ThiS [Lentisphaeria bacterium]